MRVATSEDAARVAQRHGSESEVDSDGDAGSDSDASADEAQEGGSNSEGGGSADEGEGGARDAGGSDDDFEFDRAAARPVAVRGGVGALRSRSALRAEWERVTPPQQLQPGRRRSRRSTARCTRT